MEGKRICADELFEQRRKPAHDPDGNYRVAVANPDASTNPDASSYASSYANARAVAHSNSGTQFDPDADASTDRQPGGDGHLSDDRPICSPGTGTDTDGNG
ncbi:MAG: hypothetical protein EPO00_11315 [Chloroflexota bacterium]|nr:MAG: hypothetical protein EPO00_11315 [Chloroflexota bacterium]